jgi:hypothetical protein
MPKIPIKQKTFNPLVNKGFGLVGDQIPMDGTFKPEVLTVPAALEITVVTSGLSFGFDSHVRLDISLGVTNADVPPGNYIFISQENIDVLINSGGASSYYNYLTEGYYLVIPDPVGGATAQQIWVDIPANPGNFVQAIPTTPLPVTPYSFIGDPVRGNVNMLVQPDTLPYFTDLSYITKGYFDTTLGVSQVDGCTVTYSVQVLDSPVNDDMTGATDITPAEDKGVEVVIPGTGNETEFPFFDNTYTSFVVSNNGYIVFGGESPEYYDIGAPIPSPLNPPNDAIYVWGTDLTGAENTNPGTVQWKDFTTYIVVEWLNVSHWDGAPPLVTVRAKLYKNNSSTPGVIEIHTIQAWTPEAQPVVQGVENADGTLGTAIPGSNYEEVPSGKGSYYYEFIPGVVSVNVLDAFIRPTECHNINDIIYVDETGTYAGKYSSQIQSLNNFGTKLLNRHLPPIPLVEEGEIGVTGNLDGDTGLLRISGFQNDITSTVNRPNKNCTVYITGYGDPKIDGYRRVLSGYAGMEDSVGELRIETDYRGGNVLLTEEKIRSLTVSTVLFGQNDVVGAPAELNGTGVTTLTITQAGHGLTTGDYIQVHNITLLNLLWIPDISIGTTDTWGGFYDVLVLDPTRFQIQVINRSFADLSYNFAVSYTELYPSDPTDDGESIESGIYGNTNMSQQPDTLPNWTDLSYVTRGWVNANAAFILADGTINPSSTQVIETIPIRMGDGVGIPDAFIDFQGGGVAPDAFVETIKWSSLNTSDLILGGIEHVIGITPSNSILRMATLAPGAGSLSTTPSIYMGATNANNPLVVLSLDDYGSANSLAELYDGYSAFGYAYESYMEATEGYLGVYSGEGGIPTINGDIQLFAFGWDRNSGDAAVNRGIRIVGNNSSIAAANDIMIFNGKQSLTGLETTSPVSASASLTLIIDAGELYDIENAFFGGGTHIVDLQTIGASISQFAALGGNTNPDKSNYLFSNNIEIQNGLLRHDPAAATSRIIEYGDGTIHSYMHQSGGTDNVMGWATRGNGWTDASWYGNPSGWIEMRGTSHPNGSQVLIGSNTSFFYIANENPGIGGAVYNMALGGNENGLRLGGVGGAVMSTANFDINKGVILASRNSLMNVGTTVNGAIIGGRNHALNSGSIDTAILGGNGNVSTHPRVAMLGGSNLVNSSLFTGDYAVAENLEVQGGILNHTVGTGVAALTRTFGNNVEEYVASTGDQWYMVNDGAGGFTKAWYWMGGTGGNERLHLGYGQAGGANGNSMAFYADQVRVICFNTDVLKSSNANLSTLNTDSVPTAISSRNSALNGATRRNSVALGGVGLNIDKDDFAFAQNLEIQGGNGRVTAGDFEIVNSASGVILNSASFRWRLTVDDTGTITTTVVP